MNKKGQALVEFVIILPILVLIFMMLVDMGNILYKRYQLENDLDYISDLYLRNKTTDINNYTNENNIKVDFVKSENKVTINLNKNVDIVTPGLSKVLNSPYNIQVKKVIYNE